MLESRLETLQLNTHLLTIVSNDIHSSIYTTDSYAARGLKQCRAREDGFRAAASPQDMTSILHA